jgi:hypothetical protein
MAEVLEHEEREALLDEVERELRRFVEEYLWVPEWLWSPETVRLMRVVRPKLEVLDELAGLRSTRAARPGAMNHRPRSGEPRGEGEL